VGQAYNGQEAIEMFNQMIQKPDIILMDHRMPLLNGISATKAIVSANPSSKILFLSAENTVAKEAIKVGALEFLIKPIRIKQLLAVIEKYLFQ
jgi:YesN/AraC family two-component response regulator